ncbi:MULTISPECIES: NADPH-dependent F420 reductase [Cupriavidus]|uniref:NADP oxidoreductase n=1 Tax=Cupriavidus oxalaticus TaxID=96344 RepID=A0A4P7L531_9BURK|nr:MULTISPECIES: NADPH-dependent F420 reductase [Cupriavidus]QBY50450.1 NADP oxidoreductase [Cupriavidus oxalaticus]TDF64102.1 NADP oxidoreductase [Cupriavidus sp. L7L]
MQEPANVFNPERRRMLRTGAMAMVALSLPPLSACARKPAAASDAGPGRIGVIGSGRIGGTIGGLWVKAGHPVLFSSRHPEALKPLVDGLGPLARAGTVAEAIAFADVLFLATPYNALPQLSQENAGAWSGKIVLDATNAFAQRDGAIADEAQRNGIGITTAKYLRGARVVRAFNFMGATNFANEHHRPGGLIAVPIAGDDEAALQVAARLVRDAGFEPVVVGPLASADRFAPGGPLFRQIGTAEEFRRKMSGQ